MRRNELREADLFLTDLLGHGAAGLFETSVSTLGLDRGPWRSAHAEPFLGDSPKDSWVVVGRPGEPVARLRADDLVVRRDGGRAWRCLLAGDVDRRALYERGPERLLRDGTVVLRRRPAAAAAEGYGELVEVCGFFGPNDVRRSEQQIREAVVA